MSPPCQARDILRLAEQSAQQLAEQRAKEAFFFSDGLIGNHNV